MNYNSSDENTAVANDMAVMLEAAAALWKGVQKDVDSQGQALTYSQRQHVLLSLYKITREALRGAEHLRDRLEYDINTLEQHIKNAGLEGKKTSLANALGNKKRAIESDFYTETSFNQ